MTKIKNPFPFFFIFFFSFGACTSLQFKFDSTEEIQNAVRPHQSTLPAYELTGGQWVKEQPLFINHDFDFGMAMGIPDIGPAIAAGQRKKRNEDTAALFDELSPLPLDTLFNKAVKDFDGEKETKGKVRLYGILFGYPEAHLEAILETIKNTDTIDNRSNRFIYVTDWKPVKGKNSWSTENGKQLLESFAHAMPKLVKMWHRDHSQGSESSAIDYHFLGGKTPQKGSGWILEKNPNSVIIISKTIPNTVITFPRAKLKIMESTQIP